MKPKKPKTAKFLEPKKANAFDTLRSLGIMKGTKKKPAGNDNKPKPTKINSYNDEEDKYINLSRLEREVRTPRIIKRDQRKGK
jgi:hypothetical protein